jgi:hypothetical protein
MATSFRVGAIAAFLIAATVTAGVVCIGATGKGTNDDEKLTKLFVERTKLADKAYEACDAAYQAGMLTLDVVLTAVNERAEAKLALCKTKAERLTIREEQVKLIKSYEAKIKAFNDAAAKGGEFHNQYMAGVERVKAEIALELEKREAPAAR